MIITGLVPAGPRVQKLRSALQVTLSFNSSRVGPEGKMQLQMKVFVAVLSTTPLMLQLVTGELDYTTHGQGMHLHGNFSIVGFFPLHYGDKLDGRVPAVASCKE